VKTKAPILLPVTPLSPPPKNIAEPHRHRWQCNRHIRIACCIPKATDTHTECVILVAFPLQQWLHERASMLRYTYIACLVTASFKRLKSEIHANRLKNSVPNSQKHITSSCHIWRPHNCNVEDSLLQEYAAASTCKYRTVDTLKKGVVRSSLASITI
jgi:hypothetical protein